MLTIRQKEMLVLLMKNKEAVTAEWIAKELQVSDRTIRKEMKDIQNVGKHLGITIESIKGKGYKLHIQHYSLLYREIDPVIAEPDSQSSTDFSEQDIRVNYILKHLLLEKEYTKLEQFEKEMFVSKSTIQKDIKMVRSMLANYSLELVTKPHYGMKIEGNEYKKRLCFSNYILHVKSENTNLLFHEQLLEKVKSVLIDKVTKYRLEISDMALENLTNHILIACKRIENGFIIDSIVHVQGDKYPFEKMVAKEIIAEVEDHTNILFPESEIDYIIIHLLGTKLLNEGSLLDYDEFKEARSIVECMMKRLKTELRWDFHDDQEFKQALILHIRPAINRLRYQMNTRNPLLKEIKAKYPSAFDGAVIASKCMEEYLSIKIGEHEIAYIALHIGVALENQKTQQKKIKRAIVVCATGLGSAKLLFYRLKEIFQHDLDIIECISFYKLAFYDLSSIDLIISTIPISEDIGKPVQVVHTFLEEEDIHQIKGKIAVAAPKQNKRYLDRSRVFIQKNIDNKENVIRFLSHELYKQGLVTKDYEKLVLEREAVAATSYGNLVAIPHPSQPETEQTFWTICTLARPIIWHDNQVVQLVCLLNIQKGAKGDLENMFQQLIKIIEDKSLVQKIIKSQSITEITSIFNLG